MKITNENAIMLKDKCKHIMNEIRELDTLSKALIICETDDERHFNKFLSKALGQMMNFRGVLNHVSKDEGYKYQARGDKNDHH